MKYLTNNLDIRKVLVDHWQKLRKKYKKLAIGNSRYIYQSKLDKARIQHDMAYGGFKDLPKRIASDNVLCDKEFSNAKNQKYDGYQ